MSRKPDRYEYFAKVFQRKDGDASRRVVSFDKSVKKPNGEWEYVRPSFIEYEDGERTYFAKGPVTMKYLENPKGNHEANIYQAIWDDDKGDGDDIPF